MLRNHVTFLVPEPCSIREVAEAFRSHFLDNSLAEVLADYQATAIVEQGSECHFQIAWVAGNYHPVWVGLGEAGTGRCLIRHSPIVQVGSTSVTLQLADWLRGTYADLRWYTGEEWNGRRVEWQALPY